MRVRSFNASAVACACTLALASIGLAEPVAAQEPGRPARSAQPRFRSNAPVTLNFVNADIEAVSRAMAAMIDQPILVDPRVKGTITVYSEQPIPVRDAWLNYLASLRGLGFALVDSNGLLKVVPEAEAKLQTGTVIVGAAEQRGDQVLTQVFRLNHENPNNLVAVLRPLISPNNTINANPGTSSLVITDYADNLARLGRIIAALDQPAATEVDVIPLQHAVAADIAVLVQKLGEGSATAAPGVPGATQATSIVADPRSNALIVRAANPARLASIRALVARLDRPGSDGPAGGLYVVHLKNADATRLAAVLRAAFGGGGGSGGTSGGSSLSSTSATPPSMTPQATANAAAQSAAATAPVASAGQPSTGGFIQADPASNSLIITAAEPLYRQMRSLIDQLDSRRAQVYIESMIVEVSGGDAADFGFQWLGILGSDGNRSIQAVQNLPTGSTPGIVGINTGLVQGSLNLGDGLNVGLVRTINGVNSLAAILRLLQSQSATNVVSTPNLITLDNEEAKIVVGENVPFITGQFTNTGTATTNPFQTIERKDVGITLRIKPQIGEGGAIRMQLYQEQSSVKTDTAAGTSNAGPSTTKRSIEGTVTVDDGQILVLGGLIEDNYTTTKSKVPLLGDLPLLGPLFRSESRTRKRTNLMVFLRPVVMRDADAASRFSLDRYDQIRARQVNSQPTPSIVLPVPRSPVLPQDARTPLTVAPLDAPMPAPAASEPAPPKAP
ncbi:type II secretion system secretin GspD [Aquabacterium humicola]|uniref:type II secretion system secretin GspD n=1 Tax=Aquabacterium humicola TaxID=3237377 RepID=UPI0025434693|nr:type II secretion system secretin GspD [Rubrivivax pictus]